MQISIYGRTDKRPCIYSLLKILEPLGDACFITPNPWFGRLMENPDAPEGFYRNTHIYITQASADEMWKAIDQNPKNFDNIILDGLYNENTDLTIYVRGAGDEEADIELLESIPDILTIQMGKGKNGIPYCREMLENLEFVEYYKQLKVISPELYKQLCIAVSPIVNIPVKSLMKAGTQKKPVSQADADKAYKKMMKKGGEVS